MSLSHYKGRDALYRERPNQGTETFIDDSSLNRSSATYVT